MFLNDQTAEKVCFVSPRARGLRQGQGEITHQLPSWTKQTELGEKGEFNSSPSKSE